ncbi:Nudix (Nucleoside diphosphate linked moiety X)-type motif 1 [Mortierella polycephala]|uniref:Nudix (Nucleoside diphosphate linked moiety X)-type motif 1 n=1 Tax=Mortierella polycephala TaxID=41804 RepID=A0A9P6PMT8_9FUNG|nr:Nudix (Nucleoside diphosphate linked moiety X)-type motif 1 [Mortierella polycephala]
MTASQNIHGHALSDTNDGTLVEHESRDAAFELSFLGIRKIFTLIFIHDQERNQLLLGKKQRGPLLGQWNGFGGKVERGLETVLESARRELQEEAFIQAPLYPIGFIQWVVESKAKNEPIYRDIMVIYKACSITSQDHSSIPALDPQGIQQEHITEFKPSDEMAPAWWDVDHLPWDSMRINHKVWYPFMLADRPFRGVYWYETRTSVAEGSENAQRENAKEIWVEDLSKRCFQFGDRVVGAPLRNIVQGHLEMRDYATRLGLSGACYFAADTEGEQNLGSNSDPVWNCRIDEEWLRTAVEGAEHDWIV